MSEHDYVSSGADDAPDAITSATSWAEAAKALDAAEASPCEAPPLAAPPGIDATTGATPGVASACKDLGLTSPKEVSHHLGIKPPGEA